MLSPAWMPTSRYEKHTGIDQERRKGLVISSDCPPQIMTGEKADTEVIAIAKFEQGFIGYSWILAMVLLISTFVGIILIPIWLLFGRIVHKKQLENCSLILTKNGIKIKKGWIFKAQQNIPLDKLTDISIHEGPLLNFYGIVKIAIETAGATPFHLTGLSRPIATKFRDVVMEQRDALASLTASGANTSAGSAGDVASQSNDVLVEIRDILQQINTSLSNKE